MKASEFRIGNMIEYHLIDNIGPVDEWVETSIDWEDLRQLSEDQNSFNEWHRPIPLTEEWLLRFGFEKRESSTCVVYHIGTNEITHDWLFDLTWLIRPDLIGATDAPFYRNGRHIVQYVHQLQNLYFALIGQELELKPETK